ncbi:MAG: LacI family DNA-binding transcriptional regulator [Ignavibacteriales bacterium]|nr:LacI family DNA-binding transcriptional regulator [Ignavibacteriales bacterium]
MKTTIKDVAKHAGVSIATVSLVINNNTRISSETKRKVLRSIKTLNYHPSRSARDLVSKKTGNIGFLLTDDHFLRTEPFYSKIFLGTEFEARDGEYYVLLTTVKSNFTKEDSLPRFILEKSVDGIIIAGKVPQNLIDRICVLEIPIVFVDYETNINGHSHVLIDNVQGGIIATNHLLELGHKNIGFIGGDINHPSIHDRFLGYKQALEKANLNVNPSHIFNNTLYTNRQNGYVLAKKLLEHNEGITAVFACNDAMAFGAMQYLRDNGIKVPDEISIVGFDDVDVDLLLKPPLTTMRVQKMELGIEAFRLVVEKLKNNNSSAKKILVPVELIVRESTKQL